MSETLEKARLFLATEPRTDLHETVEALVYTVEEALRFSEFLKKESDRLGCGRGDDTLYISRRVRTVIEEALDGSY